MHKIVIIGGGASGFFAALQVAQRAKELNQELNISILEATSSFLTKVRISGGGRCNVTHNIFNPKVFIKKYPRGSKELLSPFYQFQAEDTCKWFKANGIDIRAEEDGRMFPSTNKSETIINCFLELAYNYRINLKLKHAVEKIEYKENFIISLKNRDSIQADKVILATGSSPIGYKLARNLNHSITDLAPSLFSFKISSSLLKTLAGISFPNSIVSIKKPKKISTQGPMLITHWGLSGPSILKLSAWGAREFKQLNYKSDIFINWTGLELKQIKEQVEQLIERNLKLQVKNAIFPKITKRFWINFLNYIQIPLEKRVSELNKKEINKIIEYLFSTKLSCQGKNRFKDEFVECGGVNLKEINFKTMQSKHNPNLYITGELLDIDGITGGFNFQNAWTTAFIAASHIVQSQMAE